MKILITGATGFIGKHVVDSIENLSKDISIIVTASNEQKLNDLYADRKVKIIPYDFYKNHTELSDLNKYFDFPDKLIHLAWKGLPNYNDTFHITENLVKDFAFISNLIQNGIKDITITGTCFEYGLLEGELEESMTTNPTNFYALAKDTLRKMLELYQTNFFFNFKWVRLFYMYGEGQHSGSIVPQLESALNRSEESFNMSGGEQIRDYLPVTIVASNIVKVALQSQINGVINICSGRPVRLVDFINQYLISNNKHINLNLGYYPYSSIEPMAFWGSNKKLKSIK